MKVLFFEPDYRGHQKKYIEHIVESIIKKSNKSRYTFLVHPKIKKELSAKYNISRNFKKVKFIQIEKDDAKVCNRGALILKDWKRWSCVREGVRATGADHVHFLQIDPIQLSLALRRGLPRGCSVSGILFKPSIHYRKLWNDNRSWREFGRDIRKSITYNAMLTNPRLSSLLSLDPYFPHYARQHLINGSRVEWVCDPISFVEPSLDSAPSVAFPDEKTSFLLFGSLAKRKGILKTLASLQHLPKRVRSNVSITFAGKLREDVRDSFQSDFRKAQRKYPEASLHIEDRFLSESELAGWVSKADVILAPYQRVVGSSGILLWACAQEKPILTQDYGLIGAYVRKHDLGLSVDTTSEVNIARGIEEFTRHSDRISFQPSSMRKLKNRHHPGKFANTILNTITKQK